MFAATITVTVGATPRILNRINQDGYGSEYALFLADREFNLKIRHQKITGKVASAVPSEQHNVQLIETVYPGQDGLGGYDRSVNFTFRTKRSDTREGIRDTSSALVGWLTSANVLALANWEN